MKVFLLEGCDGAGKTTLAQQLDLLAGSSYVEHLHFSQPKSDDAWAEYGEPIVAAAARVSTIDEDGWLIIDRAHISEMIYGPIFRGRVIGKRWQWRKLEQLLDNLDTTRLYVAPGKKTIADRLFARGDDFVTLSQMLTISRAYDRKLKNNPKWFQVDQYGQRMMEVLTR